MPARTASASGQSRSASDAKGVPRACSGNERLGTIEFLFGHHVFWALRPECVDTAFGNGERASPERGTHSLCGWLRIHGTAYLVFGQTEKVDDAVDSGPEKSEPWKILSERELQIAMLVTLGKGTKQIAGHLRISEHTVQSYMRRIFFKLHVSTRTAMVAQLLRSLVGPAHLDQTPSQSRGRYRGRNRAVVLKAGSNHVELSSPSGLYPQAWK